MTILFLFALLVVEWAHAPPDLMLPWPDESSHIHVAARGCSLFFSSRSEKKIVITTREPATTRYRQAGDSLLVECRSPSRGLVTAFLPAGIGRSTLAFELRDAVLQIDGSRSNELLLSAQTSSIRLREVTAEELIAVVDSCTLLMDCIVNVSHIHAIDSAVKIPSSRRSLTVIAEGGSLHAHMRGGSLRFDLNKVDTEVFLRSEFQDLSQIVSFGGSMNIHLTPGVSGDLHILQRKAHVIMPENESGLSATTENNGAILISAGGDGPSLDIIAGGTRISLFPIP